MFFAEEDLSLHITRGDTGELVVRAVDETTDGGETPYIFKAGDVLRLKVYEKKNCDNVVLQKDFGVEQETEIVSLALTEIDTRIGDTINKPVDYWYEIELNPFTEPQTIVGYDDDGAKVFKLYPEGKDTEVIPPTPEEVGAVDSELSLTSEKAIQNQAVARAIAELNSTVNANEKSATEDITKTNDRITKTNTEVVVLKARVSNLANIDEGSTTGDAELIDIRVGADGATYDTAGNAVRNQITGIYNFINYTNYNDNFREIDLTNSMLWDSMKKDNSYVYIDNNTGKGVYRYCSGYNCRGTRVLYLSKGDILYTNADTVYDNSTSIMDNTAAYPLNQQIGLGVLLSNIVSNNDIINVAAYGREKFDGSYVAIEIATSGYYTLSYKADVDYDVRVFVYHDKRALFSNKTDWVEELYPTITCGYIDSSMVIGDNATIRQEVALGNPGAYTNNITGLISIEPKEDCSLVIDGLTDDNGICTNYAIAIYYTDETMTTIKNVIKPGTMWDSNVITIPLSNEPTYVRVGFLSKISIAYTRFRIVKNEYLFSHNMVRSPKLYGKKILAFGDSYVAGHSLSANYVWYSLLARYNLGSYISCGHNGYGLCLGPNGGALLNNISELDADADYYFFVCGRNDNSANVLIGDYNDTFDPNTQTTAAGTSATFMGGLNYLCEYIINKHPNAKIIAVTPWSFEPSNYVTSGLTAKPYIDAIKIISEKWGIPCLNAAGDCGIHVQSEAFRNLYFLSVTDQSHLNADGHLLMMKNSLKLIENYYN